MAPLTSQLHSYGDCWHVGHLTWSIRCHGDETTQEQQNFGVGNLLAISFTVKSHIHVRGCVKSRTERQPERAVHVS